LKQIFILEGIATVAVGIMCFFFLLDSPARAKFLNDDEKRYLVLRQQARRVVRSDEYRDKHFDRKAFFSVIFDWKMYLLIFSNWSNAVPNYALKVSQPLQSLGWSIC
jgi:hypothetical protein